VDDDVVFEDFMAARWAPLFRTAYLITGDRHQAEELLQAALAKTYVGWDRIRDKKAADSYVRTTMLRTAASTWRKRRREHLTDRVPEQSAADAAAGTDSRLALWTHILALPPRMRATLVLRFYEDLTEAQTAAELGCSVGSVKSQTSRALDRLRASLGDDATTTFAELTHKGDR
jgi:RNA polymerase sigma-70 factor (sigma-E family)